ncbi:MAG: hypothetical protein GXY83_22675 [Rhodopirellula sp.]|nr:hypothetical protein [Rhodopirellula sp.]
MSRRRQIAVIAWTIGLIAAGSALGSAQQLGEQSPATGNLPGQSSPEQPLPGQMPAQASPPESVPPAASAANPLYIPSAPTPGGKAPAWSPLPQLAPRIPAQQGVAGQQATPPGLTYINPFASAQGTVVPRVPTIQAGLPMAPPLLSEKPFSTYRAPAPVSPYMNLYQRNNSGGAVNNYYSLVRPLLEQKVYNQEVERQIQSLDAATRLQSQSLNQINQRTNYLYGVPQGGSFMQFQNHYPGFQPTVSQ